MIRLLLAFLLAAIAGPALAQARQAEVEALLAADRAFAAAAAHAATPADGLAPMLDAEVVMPVPGQGLVAGRDAVLAVLGQVPSLREGSVRWAPVRGGISADGTQGFTFGFLSVTAGDPARRDRKYLAYWVRRPEGWRVVAYRQNPRQAGEVSTAMLAPSLPTFTAAPSSDQARIEAHRASLHAAEQAFSDRAQQVGLRQAFRENGREDAMNMYSGAGFTLGLDAITANFDAQTTSPVRWSTERSFIASSGDLGVSVGIIHANTPPPNGQSGDFPFFTVWRRDNPNAPWRYIAE